jgi:DNA-binding SARP family transcriptional activator
MYHDMVIQAEIMLSGYECSIFGYETPAIDFRSKKLSAGENNQLELEKLQKIPADLLLQDAWARVRARDIVTAESMAEIVAAKDPESLIAADAYILIANLASETFSFEKAERHFFKAASICRSLGNEKGIGISLQNLASLVYLPQGQVDLSLSIMEEANYHLVKANAPAWGYPLLQAYIFDAFGDRPRLTKALDELILQVIPGSYAAGVYFLIWAKVCLDDNETQKADEYLRLSFRIANQLDLPDLSVFVRNEKSRYFRYRGQSSVAMNWASDAVNFSKRYKSPYLLGHAFIEIGQVAWFSGEFKLAEKYFSSAVTQLRKSHAYLDATRAEFLLAALYQETRQEGAEKHFLDATEEIIKNGYTSILYRDRKIVYPLIADYLKKSKAESREKANALLDLVVQTPTIPLKILGLGQFRVWQGQHPLPDQPWARRKAGPLFRYLLLQPDRSTSREQIIETLWPEMEPGNGLDILYQATSALRRILEPDLPEKFPSRYLVIEGERVSLMLPVGSYTDFDHFEHDLPAAIRNRKVEDLQTLLALHEGEVFPLERYSDWILERRNQLENLYLQGLHTLGMLHLIDQEYYLELEISRKILKLDPWNEDAILMGMQAYLGLKNAPRALIFYEEFKVSMEKELGINTRADLRELAAEITSR